MRGMWSALALWGASLVLVAASEDDHIYKVGDDVTLWVTKVGPWRNPSEVYPYYVVPYCAPETALSPATKVSAVGEVLEGIEWQNSDLAIQFRQNVEPEAYCSLRLTKERAEMFDYAIANHYWYHMFLDDLPVFGVVGEVVTQQEAVEQFRSVMAGPGADRSKLGFDDQDSGEEVPLAQALALQDFALVYTHKRLTIGYNGNQIVSVNMTTEKPVHIAVGKTFDLSYSVDWVESDVPFERRFDRYLDDKFFEHNIHWFSLANSFVMVLFLCAIVALILIRTLRNDLARYMEEEDGSDRGLADDSGWRQVHADVWRPPPQLEIIAALHGTGYQLAIMALLVVLAQVAFSLHVEVGSATNWAVAAYALTSFVAGYASGAFYRRFFYPRAARQWKTVLALTAVLLPGCVSLLMLALNAVALHYATMSPLPVMTLVMFFAIWLCVSVPLMVAGTMAGRYLSGRVKGPSRVSPVPRPLPPQPWYLSGLFVSLAAGVLPFGSIFIEVYFVMTSFWNYKVYYVYGLLALVLVIFSITTSCVAIVVAYLRLSNENYNWAWVAFLGGASTGGYVFAYATYYFVAKTAMHGLLQTVYYFGYTTLACSCLGLGGGAIALASTATFVRAIYAGLKID